MIILLVLFITLGGVLGDETEECDFITMTDACIHLLSEEPDAENMIPNEEELTQVCPEEMKYLECFYDQEKNCEIEERATGRTFLRNWYGIAQDLCDEDTPLHKDYVASAECYKSLYHEGTGCTEIAETLYLKYKTFLELEHPERLDDSEDRGGQRVCMTETYTVACITEKLQEKCGDVASSTFLELVVRSKYLRQFCDDKFVEELKETFAHTLGLVGDEPDIYASAFHFIKK